MGGACVGVGGEDPAGACKAAAAVFCVNSGVEDSSFSCCVVDTVKQCRWCPSLVRVSLRFSLSFFPSNKQTHPDV